MAEFTHLVARANRKGVRLHNVEPVRVLGRGLGMRAKARVKEGQLVMSVPMGSTRNLTTVPKDISVKLARDASIHCMLALDITLDHSPQLEPWRAALPSLSDVETCMPFMWDNELQQLLPYSAQTILSRQKDRFKKDWATVTKAFPDVKQQNYLYSWFMINTRTFYHESEGTEQYPEDDRLALLPLADLFNHADRGCKVSFSSDGYSITAERAYRPGDEMHISYGSHSDDYLLVEYGFVPEENQWDKICLHDALMRGLSDAQVNQLAAAGCSGPFTLTQDLHVSEETLSALRIIHRSQEEPGASGSAESTDNSGIGTGNVEVRQVIANLVADSEKKLADIRALSSRRGQSGQCESLVRMWSKIHGTGVRMMKRLAAEEAH